jgi:hypothetical protein
MKSVDQLSRKKIIETINKDWMTHDGMWFLHCLQEFGIEKTNKLNLAAIKSMAQVETVRVKKLLGMEDHSFEDFNELKTFFLHVKALFIPEFMGLTTEFFDDGRLMMTMQPENCFAYKGIRKMGVIDQYQCGVLYRIEVMFKSLGLDYTLSRPIGDCQMAREGKCRLEVQFNFPD